MRVSVEQGDAAFGEHDVMSVRVWLDGVEQFGALTADDETGYLKRGKLDADGKYFSEDGVTIATEEMHGTVRIELPSVDSQLSS